MLNTRTQNPSKMNLPFNALQVCFPHPRRLWKSEHCRS